MSVVFLSATVCIVSHQVTERLVENLKREAIFAFTLDYLWDFPELIW